MPNKIIITRPQDTPPPLTMQVLVDGEWQERKIIRYETLAEFYGDPITFLGNLSQFFPIPETFEGERLYKVATGSVYIIKNGIP